MHFVEDGFCEMLALKRIDTMIEKADFTLVDS